MKVYPNPLTDNTTLSYSISRNDQNSLAIFDYNGHIIKIIHKGSQEEGTYELKWGGSDMTGHPLSLVSISASYCQEKMSALLK